MKGMKNIFKKMKPFFKEQKDLLGHSIYRIRVEGHMSAFIHMCIEDMFIRAADDMGIGIRFVKSGPCDMVVICDDTVFESNLNKIYDKINKEETLIVGFGLGCSAQDLHRSKSEFSSINKLLKRMDAVSVRSESTLSLIKKYAKNKQVEVVGDPIFSFKPLDSSEKAKRPALGLCVCSWDDETYKQIAKICDLVVDKHNYEIHFLCFSNERKESDEIVALKIIDKMQNKNKIVMHPYTGDIVLSYSQALSMDSVISMRSSAGIISLLEGKPTVNMEIRGQRGKELFSLLAVEETLVDIKNISLEELEKKLALNEDHINLYGSISREKALFWRNKQYEYAKKVLTLLLSNAHNIAMKND